MNRDSQWSKQEACFARTTRVLIAVNYTTSVTSGNEFDVPSILHRQVSLVAVNQICVIHEAMKGCEKLKIYLCNPLSISVFIRAQYDWNIVDCIIQSTMFQSY